VDANTSSGKNTPNRLMMILVVFIAGADGQGVVEVAAID
jgi:hypothetical protein